MIILRWAGALLLLPLIALLTNCSEKVSNCCREFTSYQSDSLINDFVIDSREIDMGHVSGSLQQYGLYANGGYQFIRKNGTVYLSFINSSRDLLIYTDLFSNFEKEVSIKDKISKKGACAITIVNDTFHIVNVDTYIYQAFRLDSGLNLIPLYSYNLKDFINFKRLYLNSNLVVDKRMTFSYPYLILSYGKYKARNEIEKTPCIKFNILTKKSEKILGYPEKFRNCDIRIAEPLLERSEANSIVTVFLKDNSVFKVDLETNAVQKFETITFNSNYMCYDASLVEDLAYTSKVDLNDEQNVNLIYNGNYYFLLKDLRKESKHDPSRSAIILLSKKLEYLGAYFPGSNISPRLSFPYKDGLVIMDYSFSKGYYYEFKGKN